MAESNFVDISGNLVEVRQVSGMSRVIRQHTDQGEVGVFDVHMNGTVGHLMGEDLETSIALWNRLFKLASAVTPSLRTFQEGSLPSPQDQFVVDTEQITLVGAVQLLPVECLHVPQRALVPIHLNGSILNADYATVLEAENGRQQVIESLPHAEGGV